LDKAYNSITERIDALIVIEGVSVYETFVKTLNVVIAKYAALHHHRRKRLSQDSQPTTEVTQ
jgi:flagellar biosynthesis chaperone FliJ